MKWEMYAHYIDGSYCHVGSYKFVKYHMMDEYPIHNVIVSESEDGNYYGWISSGETKPSLIQPRLLMFKVQFPYGYKQSEKHGQGKMVKLDIVKNENPDV